jgi:hypothetical protein
MTEHDVPTICTGWLAEYNERRTSGGAPPLSKDIAYAVRLAKSKAQQYREFGTAYVAYEPGNGTRYSMVLLDLVWDQAVLALRDEAPEVLKAKDTDPDADARWQAARVSAQFLGPVAHWGGPLLIALPEFTPGRSMVCTDQALLTPEFIAKQVDLPWPDAMPIAWFLSLFCDAIHAS